MCIIAVAPRVGARIEIVVFDKAKNRKGRRSP